MAKRGSRGKLTPQLQARICQIIANGNYVNTACDIVGIAEQTFYRWFSDGEKAKSGKYREFYESVKRAKAQAFEFHVSNIKTKASTNWQASAWFLERKDPDRWGKRDRIEMTHKHDWKSELLELYQNGQLTREEIERELDDSLVKEFFAMVDTE